MKKILFILTLSILCTTIIEAQFTKAGGGLAVGTGAYYNDATGDLSHKTGNPAITFRGIYEFSLPFHISPSINIFLPRVTSYFEEKRIISAFLFDIDAHYVFNSLDRFEFYGLGGLNITVLKSKYKYDYPDSEPYASTESALGLNIGAGSYMKMTEQLDVFAELKYILSSRCQFMLTAGVLLNIDWLRKNENKIL
jgi:hypothetical protein